MKFKSWICTSLWAILIIGAIIMVGMLGLLLKAVVYLENTNARN